MSFETYPSEWKQIQNLKGEIRDMQQNHITALQNAITQGFNLGYKIGIEQKAKWIPVSERMPEDGQNVLFCDIEDDIMLGYHIKGRPDTHFSQDGTFDDIKNVKAWMPLPEAHEEKEETE